MQDLERVIRRSIIEGQPRTHAAWKKIIICVEGVYRFETSAHDNDDDDGKLMMMQHGGVTGGSA
jgi:hypothetical protein